MAKNGIVRIQCGLQTLIDEDKTAMSLEENVGS